MFRFYLHRYNLSFPNIYHPHHFIHYYLPCSRSDPSKRGEVVGTLLKYKYMYKKYTLIYFFFYYLIFFFFSPHLFQLEALSSPLHLSRYKTRFGSYG